VGARDPRQVQKSQPSARATVGVVARDRLYRESLVRSLNESGVKAVDLTNRVAQPRSRSYPGVLLLDLPLDQIQAVARTVRRHRRHVRMIAIADANSDCDVVNLAEYGVIGVVARSASLREVLGTIADAARGALRGSDRLAAALAVRIGELAAGDGVPASNLSMREQEVLGFLALGLTNKEIAMRLNIQAATVKNHVHSILEKLNVHRRGQAAAWARVRSSREGAG